MRQKRYEYLASDNGKPVKKWTEWFNYNGPEEPYQLNKKLKNEYRTV